MASGDERSTRELAPLAGYALVAIVFTYPLIRHPTTTFPGGNDTFGFIWNNWWIDYAITHLHTNPYFTNYILTPFTTDLRLHTFGFLYGLMSIPLMFVLTPVAVLNTQILATAMLNGYATSKLTTYLTESREAGFVSGLIVASTPAINFHFAVGRVSCAALWPAIFALLAFLSLVDRPRLKSALWLAVWLIAVMMTDQQVVLYCVCWLAILAGALLISRRRDLMSHRALSGLVIAATVVAIPGYLLCWKPFVNAGGYTVPGAVEALHYSYPLRLLWTPLMIWGVYGVLMPIGLLAAMTQIRRMPTLIPWTIGSIMFVMLSLGPVVMGTTIPLPFSLMQRLPGLAQFRTPYRMQIPAAIGLAVIVGVLMAHALRTLGPRAQRLLLAGAVCVVFADGVTHRIVSGFELQTMRREAVYEEIARDSRDCVVLEVPVGVRSGTDQIGSGESLSYYQPVHRKRILNGMIGRVPLAALDYYRASPAIMFLAHDTPPPGDVLMDVRRRLRDLAVGYVVIHPEMMDGEWFEETLKLFAKVDGIERLETHTNVVAFRVEGP